MKTINFTDMKITLRQLEFFIAITQTENLTLAADSIHITQSAISMALAQLENQLGHPLFDRHGKKLILNLHGKNLLPHAIDVIERVKAIESSHLNAEELKGELRIGASSTVGSYLLPQKICQFIERHPTCHIQLEVSNTEHIIHQLLEFKIDLGFIEGECHHEKIEQHIWREDKLVVFAASNHPLCKSRRASLKQLNEAQWIMREVGSGTRQTVEKNLTQHLDQINIQLTFDNTEAIKQAVLHSLAISCLSLHAIERELALGVFKKIAAPFTITRQLQLIRNQHKYQSALEKTFIDFLLSQQN